MMLTKLVDALAACAPLYVCVCGARLLAFCLHVPVCLCCVDVCICKHPCAPTWPAHFTETHYVLI